MVKWHTLSRGEKAFKILNTLILILIMSAGVPQ